MYNLTYAFSNYRRRYRAHAHTKEQIREEENTVQTTQHKRKSSKMIPYLKFF